MTSKIKLKKNNLLHLGLQRKSTKVQDYNTNIPMAYHHMLRGSNNQIEN